MKRAALQKLASTIGAVVREALVGRTFEIEADAPAGRVWSCDGSIHQLIATSNDGPPAWAEAARDDIAERMRYGTEPCPLGAGCEWCHESAAR
jgi:hypothetical protein